MCKDIILEKFNEWTGNLESVQSRIQIFTHIRDIPYCLIPEFIDPEKGPIGILTENRGSCSPKHFLLYIMFHKLGIKTRYVTYPFRWNDPKIDYPVELRRLANDMPIECHVACKSFINNKWILVDVTWDPPLKKVGFPVNEKWDGMSATVNAVTPLDEIVHKDVEARMVYVGKRAAFFTEKENTLKRRFYYEFNAWLKHVRTQ